VSETPLFLSNEIRDKLIDGVEEIVEIVRSKEFKNSWEGAIPSGLEVPNEDEHTTFLQIDFALCHNEERGYYPQLIELQGFPSLYAYQTWLSLKYKEHFNFPDDMVSLFNGLTKETYFDLLKKVVVGDCDPENVILLEIEPDLQKTAIDFICTEKAIGVKPICISDVIKHGNKLFYKRNGVEVPIHRIYNRVIFDELDSKTIDCQFKITDDLDILWVGHPNWFFKISKHSMPYIKSQYAPQTHFLNELDRYPDDLENYVLKPLFSFAGSGVEIDVTKEKLDKVDNKDNFILQQKINYAPLIETPDEPAKAEIRMMLLWLDEKPILVNNLVRTSKGKMIGVDYNKNKTWIGASVAFHH